MTKFQTFEDFMASAEGKGVGSIEAPTSGSWRNVLTEASKDDKLSADEFCWRIIEMATKDFETLDKTEAKKLSTELGEFFKQTSAQDAIAVSDIIFRLKTKGMGAIQWTLWSEFGRSLWGTVEFYESEIKKVFKDVDFKISTEDFDKYNMEAKKIWKTIMQDHRNSWTFAGHHDPVGDGLNQAISHLFDTWAEQDGLNDANIVSSAVYHLAYRAS